MSSFFQRNLKRSYPKVATASGVWVEDETGQRYLDGCSGAVSANLGHGLKEITEAITRQLEQVAFAHTSQFLSEPGLRLADALVELAGDAFAGGKVYFCSGGTEAVETALKLSRAYYLERDGVTARNTFISRWNSYHGSSFGAMAVTGHPARRKPYLPLLKDQLHISPAYPNRCCCGFGPGPCQSNECSIALAKELETTIQRVGAENVLAFIAEPIVGAALGAVGPVGGYWQAIREICTRYDILFIADEVMTGLGRAGANFALERWQVSPDIIVVGKGLAAGYMPLSAVIASPSVVAPFLAERSSGAFEHGFTYSGHPLACAAGLAAIEYMQTHGTIRSVARREREFAERLHSLMQFDFVGNVRSYGFLGGVEFVANRETKAPFPVELKLHRQITDLAMQNGLMVYPGAGFVDGGAGDHIIVAPPLNISEQDMDSLFERLTHVFSDISKQLMAACTK